MDPTLFELEDEGLVVAAEVMAPAKFLRHTSTSEQRRAAATIIADARRRLYLLLAEEPTE